MRWLAMALRRLRDDAGATAGFALLVLVTALLAALAPRLLASLADDAVRAEVRDAAPVARNIVLQQLRTLDTGPADDPLSQVRFAGEALDQTIPHAVEALVARRDIVVDSGRYRVQAPTTDPAFVRLRIHEGVDDHLRYVEGRAPTATLATRDDVGREMQDGVPVYEVGVSRATADRFGLSVGQVVPLAGDPGDPLVGRAPQDQLAFAAVTGIYEVLDPDSDFWLDDPQLIHPVIRALSAEVQLLDAALVVDPGLHAALVEHASPAGSGLRYSWREFLDPGRLTEAAMPRLITAFHRLQVAYPSANVSPSVQTALRTGLPAILEQHQARWAAAEGILAVMALGPALVAVATLALIAILAAGRRRTTMALARSRGASGRQVILPAIVEGLLIAVPAALLATLAAVALVPGGPRSPTLIAAAAVVAIAVAVVTATVVSIVRTRGPAPRPGDRTVRRAGSRRLVLELLVVGLAIGAAWLLRERGLSSASSAGAVRGFDPLIAAVPALVGVAAGIVVVRAYPYVLGAAAAVARRGRGLVPMLAARRATEGGASSAVLLVLLATATVGAFAATSLAGLERGAEIAAWEQVGGSYRIQAPSGALPSSLDPRTLPGVETVSGVFEATVPVGLSGPTPLFVIPEAAPMAAALAGTPIEPRFPDGFTTPGSGPIPVIVSRSLADSPRGVKLGDTFSSSIEGYTLQYRVADVRDTFPGVPADRQWILAPREWFSAQAPPARIVPVWAMVSAPSTDPATMRAAVEAANPSIRVTSEAEVAAALRTAPVTQAVRALILAAALVTAAYAAIGVAAALALAGIARTVEVARLRTLGLTGRQSLGLAVAEHGPTTLAGFLVGGALGIALYGLLRSSLGLGGLVSSTSDLPVVVQAGPLLLILAVMIVVVATGLALGAALQRRVEPASALRGRFE